MTMFSGRRKTLFLALFLVFLVAGVAMFLRTWYMPQRDVKDESAIAVTADAIFLAYNANESAANTQYLNKAVEVSGEVRETKKNQDGKMVCMLKTADPMFGVQCTLKEPADVKPGEKVIIKGICTGFLMDVVVTDAYIASK